MPSCGSLGHTVSGQRDFYLSTCVNVMLNCKHGDLRLHASATRATTRGDTPLMPMSVVPNSHPRAEAVPPWRGPLRSAEQQGRSAVLPVRQSTGTALRRHVRVHLRKIQHKQTTLPKRPRGLPRASFWLRTPTVVRVKRHRTSMLPCLPAGCFESTTKFCVLLRTVGEHGLHSIQCDAGSRLEWQEFCADARC